MKIDNFKVYDIGESIVASGFPMAAEYNKDNFLGKILCFVANEDGRKRWFSETAIRESDDFKRACKLANNPSGSGHCNFLSGVLVSANVTATIKWWHQFERYHFAQIVSSMSTMHRLKRMVEFGECRFNDKTSEACINAFRNNSIDGSGNINVDEETLAYSCPLGIELTARIATNYLQLKTIYHQRKDHKLQEWRDFCEWIKSLPFAKEFITGD